VVWHPVSKRTAAKDVVNPQTRFFIALLTHVERTLFEPSND
jgi:hypothetical protein